MRREQASTNSSRDILPLKVRNSGSKTDVVQGTSLLWKKAWLPQSDTRKQVIGYVWVSDNPTPPDFDPRVVSDPGVPYFFDWHADEDG
jgi:hypothetical protein